jgi:hypothetical protein
VVGDVFVIGQITERAARWKLARAPEIIAQREPVPEIRIGRVEGRAVRPNEEDKIKLEQHAARDRHAPAHHISRAMSSVVLLRKPRMGNALAQLIAAR